MLRKRLAAMFIPVVITITGAAFADNPASGRAATSEKAAERAAQLSENCSALHAVNQWSVSISEMADKRAKSDLVKGYARAIATANPNADAKLLAIAKEHGIAVVPMDPRTEKGKSLLDRMNAETVLLGSLEGDAWDKEYMLLVTSHQQSVIRALGTQKALAKDKDVKQFLGELITVVQNRLKTSQDILEKIYRDKV